MVARAPGRVNLIGDHTDYTGGLVMPFAIDRVTEVRGVRIDDAVVELRSSLQDATALVPLDVSDPPSLQPAWARYVGGVVQVLGPATGFRGTVTSTVPQGSGLSSSAALEVAVALALGAPADDPLALARLCQRAEHAAVGVPSGIMDQLASAAGVEGHVLVIDCHTLRVQPVPLPTEAQVVVIHSGQERTLAGSAYAERVAQCAAAEAQIGPLRLAAVADIHAVSDALVRSRARHVVSENARVRDFAAALSAGDLTAAGELMVASHRSLASDYDVSTAVLDDLVEGLCGTPGVYGARLTGAGFGGCVVALCRPGALDGSTLGRERWVVRPVAGATVAVA